MRVHIVNFHAMTLTYLGEINDELEDIHAQIMKLVESSHHFHLIGHLSPHSAIKVKATLEHIRANGPETVADDMDTVWRYLNDATLLGGAFDKTDLGGLVQAYYHIMLRNNKVIATYHKGLDEFRTKINVAE